MVDKMIENSPSESIELKGVSIDELISLQAAFVKERNWGHFHSPRNVAIALVVESAELLEHFQWGLGDSPDSLPRIEAVGAEIADVFLYLFSLCDVLGVDATRLVLEKLEVNKLRWPPKGEPTASWVSRDRSDI